MKIQLNYLINLIFLSFLLPSAFSQVSTPWMKYYGGTQSEAGNSISKTADGDYIIAGSTQSYGAGSSDIYLVKTNSLGDTLWTKTFGTTYDEYGFSVYRTIDGGCVVTGSKKTGTNLLSPNNILLIKYNLSGNKVWEQQYTFAHTSGYSVKQTSDGGFIILAEYYYPLVIIGEPPHTHVILIRANSSGVLQWSKEFPDYSQAGLGRSVLQLSDGTFVFTGKDSTGHAWIYKANSSGGKVWETPQDGLGSINSIEQTSDNGFIMFGYTTSYGSGGSDMYLVKTNPSGIKQWAKTYGGSSNDYGYSVQKTSDGGFILLGTTRSFSSNSDIWIIKTSSTGDTLWTKRFASTGFDEGREIIEINNYEYVFTGTFTQTGQTYTDMLIAKIEEQKISVIFPNGGEDLTIGSTHSITWTSTGISNVKIDYTTNNGTNWTNIISSTPSTTGSYSWTIPNTPSTNCKMFISDVSNTLINDQSNAVFTISVPTSSVVTVTSPNGGENLQVGSIHNITWASTGISNVKIDYSTNNGINWINVIQSTSASTGSYGWTVPNTASTNCKVLISDVYNALINDQSNTVFTISVPVTQVITVTSPNGGENWQVGSTHNINWTSNSVSNVKIDYTTNNGTNWINVISSTPASTGSYSWAVPNTPSNQCLVRISDYNNSATNDMSDNIFRVFIYEINIPIITNYSFGDFNNTNSYKIIGLPGANSIAMSSVISGTPGKENDWRAFWDSGTLPLTEFNNTATFNFTSGKAFWILSKNAININQTVNVVPLSADNTNSIPLHTSWNLISNPFERSVNWTAVKTANSLSENQVIYSWNDGGYNYSSEMKPFQGYYFNNTGNLDSLKIPYDPNGSLGKELLNKEKFDNEYPIDISSMLSLQVNKLDGTEKSKVFIGINPESETGFDEKDFYSAPGDFQDIRISLIKYELLERERFLFIEQRPKIEEGQSYNLIIKNASEEYIELQAKGLENFSEYEIYLLDNSLMKLYDLKKQSSIQVKRNNREKEYTLFIGSEEYISKKKSELVPTEYVLYQNYPNPFNPKTTLMFALPKQGIVSLKIYNILGEQIQELISNQLYEAGYHEVELESSTLASGIYIYRLQADSFVETKKMVLLR